MKDKLKVLEHGQQKRKRRNNTGLHSSRLERAGLAGADKTCPKAAEMIWISCLGRCTISRYNLHE